MNVVDAAVDGPVHHERVGTALGAVLKGVAHIGSYRIVIKEPQSAAQLDERYEVDKGVLEVNLGRLTMPAGTTHVEARVGTGALTVIVPGDVAVSARESGSGTLVGFDRVVAGDDISQCLLDEGYFQVARRLSLDLTIGSGVMTLVRASATRSHPRP